MRPRGRAERWDRRDECGWSAEEKYDLIRKLRGRLFLAGKLERCPALVLGLAEDMHLPCGDFILL